jgi:hypothetical protein
MKARLLKLFHICTPWRHGSTELLEFRQLPLLSTISRHACSDAYVIGIRTTRQRGWLRHNAVSRKVAGSIPDVIGYFQLT